MNTNNILFGSTCKIRKIIFNSPSISETETRFVYLYLMVVVSKWVAVQPWRCDNIMWAICRPWYWFICEDFGPFKTMLRIESYMYKLKNDQKTIVSMIDAGLKSMLMFGFELKSQELRLLVFYC